MTFKVKDGIQVADTLFVDGSRNVTGTSGTFTTSLQVNGSTGTSLLDSSGARLAFSRAGPNYITLTGAGSALHLGANNTENLAILTGTEFTLAGNLVVHGNTTLGNLATDAVTVTANIGIGNAPSGWSSYRGIDLGTYAAVYVENPTGGAGLVSNAYHNGTNWIYKNTNPASRYFSDSTSGGHKWFSAASGSATTTVSFTQVLGLELGKTLALQGTTSASGTGISFPTATILDNGAGLTTSSNFVVTGNLTVNGTTTTVNSTTISVDDKNIELGSVASPDNTSADGGGITLRGATDKTIIWDNANANWTSSENWNIPTGKVFKINNATVLSSSQVLGKTIGGTSAGDIVNLDTAQTLTNKTLTSPVLNAATGTTLGLSGAITTTGGDAIVLHSSLNSSAGNAAQFFLRHNLANVEIGNARTGSTDIFANNSKILSVTSSGATLTGSLGVSGGDITLSTNKMVKCGFGAIHTTPGVAIGSASYAGLYGTALTYLSKITTGAWYSTGGGTASAITIDEGIFSFNKSQTVGAVDTALTWTTILKADGTGLTVNGNIVTGPVTKSTCNVTQGAPGTSTIFTYSTASFLSAEIIVQIKQGGNVEIVKALVISNGADVYFEEYGRIGIPTNVTLAASFATATVTISATSTTTLAVIKGEMVAIAV